MKNRRSGITYAITLIYLVLFSVLALGFYASTTTEIEIAQNDVHTAGAQLAAHRLEPRVASHSRLGRSLALPIHTRPVHALL